MGIHARSITVSDGPIFDFIFCMIQPSASIIAYTF